MFRNIGLIFLLVSMVMVSNVKAQEIIVSAAASLTDAYNEIGSEFEKQNPGVKYVGNYASSGALYRQILQGAPADVFASANIRWMEEAINEGLVQNDESHIFVKNQVVMGVPTGNSLGLTGPDDLKDDKVTRIALGNPETVPAGRYSMDSLQGLGLWDELAPKYVYVEHVRAVLDYLRRGEVDAGFIYSSDMSRAMGAVEKVSVLPLQSPPEYPIAPMKNSKNLELARKFVELVLSDWGQSVLEKHGFSRVR